jgi:hypothetical protein
MKFKEVKEHSLMLYSALHGTNGDFYDLWYNHILFTWRWWLSVLLIILPWALWFLIRKKEHTHKLIFAGFFVMLISSYMDILGVGMHLWSYPVNALPLMPEFIIFDLCALPVATMLTIQFFPKVNPLIKAILFSGFASFIFQPINVWLGLYNNMAWKHYYSFPIIIVIYLLANRIASRNHFANIR